MLLKQVLTTVGSLNLAATVTTNNYFTIHKTFFDITQRGPNVRLKFRFVNYNLSFQIQVFTLKMNQTNTKFTTSNFTS